jgi:hypothetical protein
MGRWNRFKLKLRLRAFIAAHKYCPGFRSVQTEENGQIMAGYFCPEHGEGMAAFGHSRKS